MKKILFLACCILFCLSVSAQSLSPVIIAASGDHFSNQDVQLSWTVGETFTETLKSQEITITQGFHQTHLMVTSVNDGDDDIDLHIYPNPASQLLTVSWNLSLDLQQLILFDSRGSNLMSKVIDPGAEKADVDVSTLVPGFYFIQFKSKDNQIIKSFKIMKI